MKNIAFILLFNFISFHLSAQLTGKIRGVVIDDKQKPIPNASISLNRIKDSAIIALVITDYKGFYEFNSISEERYFVEATSAGLSKISSSIIELNSRNNLIHVPVLVMIPDLKTLQNISIETQKALIENKTDKIIVNVAAPAMSGAINAIEVLERSPGIIVSSDGTISLHGKSGVIILIDGKKTFLNTADLSILLRSLPSSTLEQIEIITTPSSKYDATGNSGIINIKTKKNKSNGFNGNIQIGITGAFYKPAKSLSVIPRSQNSFTFNYLKNKLNLFGNFSPTVFGSEYEQTMPTVFFDANNKVIGYSAEFITMKMFNNNNLLKIGLDYTFNKKNELSFVISGFIFDKRSTPVINTFTFGSGEVLSSTLNTTATENVTFKNLSSSFSFKHLFDTTGKELSIDADYLSYRNSFDMIRNTYAYDRNLQATGYVLMHGLLPDSINIYSVKTDYVQKFGNLKFETGIKITHVNNNSAVNYERKIQNSWIPDPKSNHFDYKETISALYFNINKQVKKIQLQGGLRLEYALINGQQLNSNFIKRNFTNIFPSGSFSYNINKQNQLAILYSRRVGRPTYTDLNPFVYVYDSLSQRQGNPYLLPQFSNSMELKYSFKQRFVVSINYNRTSDVISYIFKQIPKVNTDTSFVVITVPENVARVDNMGLSIIIPLQVSKWWNTNASISIFNNHYKGLYNKDEVDISQASFKINIINTFNINKKTTADMTAYYLSKSVNSLTYLEPIYYISFGLRKQIINDKGSLNLTLRDPFVFQHLKGEIKYGDIYTKFYRQFDSRRISITFRYNFGKNQLKNPKAGNKLAEEQNRIDVTGNK